MRREEKEGAKTTPFIPASPLPPPPPSHPPPCSARLDGLMRREEVEGAKITETFTGRDDRLVYRSATYISEAPDTSAHLDE